MKGLGKYVVLLFLAIVVSAAAPHKFYVAVFQVNHVPAKKVLQITSRIFIDDLDAALAKKYGRKFYLATSRETADCNEYLNTYFSEKINISINGKPRPVKFLGKEIEDDVLICYYTVAAGDKITDAEVKNTVLFESFPDQQNIIHLAINNTKKSLLLTTGKPADAVTY